MQKTTPMNEILTVLLRLKGTGMELKSFEEMDSSSSKYEL
jgi:hypothetical protein